MKRRGLVLVVVLFMVLYVVPVNLGASYEYPATPTEQNLLSDLEIGETELVERGTTTYLGDGTYTYSAVLGEYNTFNGSHFVKYLYDADTHNVTFAGHSLVLYDWYAVFSNRSQVLVDDMRWIVQYWQDQAGGRWAELDLWDHSFLPAQKELELLTFGQRYTDGFSSLDVWYTVHNYDMFKITLNFTAQNTELYRFQWQLTGVDGSPTINNKSIKLDDVNIGWGDSDLNASYDWFVATKKLDISFDNLTIGAGETYTLDPSVNPVLGADIDDDYWEDGTHKTAEIYCHVLWYGIGRRSSQWRFSLAIAQGSTVTSANFTVYEWGSLGSLLEADVRRIDEDNVGSLEGDASLPTTTDTNKELWQFDGTSGEWETVNITDMTNDAVNLGGWSSGNYMGFRFNATVFESDDYCLFEDYQNAGTNHAYMNVTYTVPPSNAVPTNDGCTLTNADDTDNLYAVYKEYVFTSNVSDADGFADIDYVEMSLYSGSAYWTIRYDEDTDTFSEELGSSYIVLGGSSSAVESSNDIDVTWYIEIDWSHSDLTNYDLRLYTVDDEPESDTDDYDLNFDIETRVDITTGPTLDDGSGTADRGDYDTVSGISVSGTVDYYGSAISPDSGDVDVWVICADVAGSPWSDTTLTDGAFSLSVDSDDSVGLDTYSFKVVIEAAGSGGNDLCFSSESDTYIADRMVVTITADGDTVVNGTQVNFTVSVIYDYDDSAFSYWNISVTNDGAPFGVFNHTSTNFNDTDESTTNVYATDAFNNETTHIITKFSSVSESVIWYPEGSPPTTNVTGEINYFEELFLSTEIWGLLGPLALITLGYFATKKHPGLGIVWYIVECVIAAQYLDLVGATPYYWWNVIILLLGGLTAWLGPMLER